jgi:adenylate cyclase class IV
LNKRCARLLLKMPRNVEVKLRLASVQALLPRVLALPELLGQQAQCIEQDDCFYAAPQGRLKLRRLLQASATPAAPQAELIAYHRPNEAAARTSDYVRVPVPDPDALHEALSRTLGVTGRVRKQRWLLLAGATRIHLDQVHGLGEFLELEVVLQEGQPEAQGQAQAARLLQRLGLAHAPLLAGSYLDMGAGSQP